MVTLENTCLQVKIKSYGAELCRLLDKRDDTDLLWDGDPAYWTGQSPVLFPIIGNLDDDSYCYEGKCYELPRHGFGRRSEFELVKAAEEQAVFRLVATAETLKQYPFSFQLDIVYRLAANTITICYIVRNLSDANMYFSIGGHPAFRCPLFAGETMQDYYLQFDPAERADRLLRHGNLLSGEQEGIPFSEGILALSPDVFKEDAIILTGLRSQSVALKSRKHAKSINVEFAGFPYLGIWSKAEGAPFLCIEPWCGIADVEGRSRDLPQKAGIVSLSGRQTFSREFTITID